MRTIFFLIAYIGSVIHYSSGSYSVLTKSVSQTNPDSMYIPTTSHTGVLGDSVGDSLIMNIPFQINLPSTIDIGLLVNDTLTDSVFVSQNNVKEWSQKIHSGINDIYWTSVPKYLIKPNKYRFWTKCKLKATKTATVQRWNWNYWLQ